MAVGPVTNSGQGEERATAMRTIAALVIASVVVLFTGVSSAQTCEITGDVPRNIRESICGIATSVHGDPSGFRLTIIATRPVATTIALQTVDARNALATIANSWRTGIGRNLGYLARIMHDVPDSASGRR